MSTALKDQLEANGFQIEPVLGTAGCRRRSNWWAWQGSQQTPSNCAPRSTNASPPSRPTTPPSWKKCAARWTKTPRHAGAAPGRIFKLVSDRLEQSAPGPGRNADLAGSVGDLKRVMTNVKTRGTWGEMQFGAIIDNVLTPDQYARNVKTVPGSDELVEFAIRLPGKREEEPVWLPIDLKYPWSNTSACSMRRTRPTRRPSSRQAMRLKAPSSSKRRRSSPVMSPPHTTDFAVLYLPTEGLFA